MEALTLFYLEFFTAFILYLFLQAFIINGIKLSAAGQTDILPDGSEKNSEMILYPVAKFLLQKTTEKIFYSKAELAGLMADLIGFNSSLGHLDYSEDGAIYIDGMNAATMNLLTDPIYKKFDVKSVVMTDRVLFYKEYDRYKFPAIIRKPIIQCVVCMASFWGLWTCLAPALLIYGLRWECFTFYLVNTIALAAVNKIVFKYV